jgi:hypothetical protein
MSGFCHRGIATVLALIICGICLMPPQFSPAQDEAAEVPQQVLVLNNGRVITGDIEDRPGGYLIQTGLGQMVIPYTQVRLTAADVPEAYMKLKATITEPTAAAHVALGTWCFENRLYDSAREQVKAALLLEPERKEARALLKNIERMTLGNQLEASIPMPPPRTRDGYQKSEVVSLDGLPTSITQDYVRRVQPLLMNKCGNARCHGTAGTSEFHMVPVRLGMSGYRAMTDQNLTMVLGYIEAADPQRSPLLIFPQATHGGQGPIWTGPRADEQLAELRTWVMRVGLANPTSRMSAGSAQKSAAGHEGQQRDPLLQQVLAEERPDAFDPALFNRMVHGRD